MSHANNTTPISILELQQEMVQQNERIIDGQEVTHDNYSFIISLNHENYGDFGHFCGGSLVHDEWVLTAAHCMSPSRPLDEVTISLGCKNIASSSNHNCTHRNVELDYYELLTSDMALVHIKQEQDNINEITQFSNVNKIEIHPDSLSELDTTPDFSVIAMGWGAHYANGVTEVYYYPDDLKEAEMIVNGSTNHGIGEGTWHTAMPDTSSNWDGHTCFGDSGSPVVIPTDNQECLAVGDANLDNELTTADVNLVISSMLDLETLTTEAAFQADVNEDTLLNILDIIEVINNIFDNVDATCAPGPAFVQIGVVSFGFESCRTVGVGYSSGFGDVQMEHGGSDIPGIMEAGFTPCTNDQIACFNGSCAISADECPSYCRAGYVEDCSGDGDCCSSSWIGDGYADCADQIWDCDLTCYDNDGGDCPLL